MTALITLVVNVTLFVLKQVFTVVFAAIVKCKKAARRTKLEYQYRQGRTIEDFNFFVEANPDVSIVEMDTVKESRERGKVFLTMIFRKTSFMAKHLLI